MNNILAALNSLVDERIRRGLLPLRRQPQRHQRIPRNEFNEVSPELRRVHELISRRRGSGNHRRSRRILRLGEVNSPLLILLLLVSRSPLHTRFSSIVANVRLGGYRLGHCGTYVSRN